VRLNPKTFQPAAKPHALTSGTTNEYGPSISKDGKLVFASIEANPDVFSLGLDVNRGKIRDSSTRLTTAAGEDIARSVSSDGKRLAFNSDRTGTVQVWVKDLVSGKERQLTSGSEKARGLVSPDGQTVAWRESSVTDQHIYLTPFDGGLGKEICSDCGVPSAWSPDGRFLVYQATSLRHSAVSLLEVATGKRSDYLKSATEQYSHGSISRDGKWIVFASQRSFRDFTLYVAPFAVDRVPPRSEWVQIAHSPEVDPAAQWSPDGNLLYFSSERDGYNCLWALHLDRATKHPQGALFAVQHFHLPSQVLVAPAYWAAPTLGPDNIFVSLKLRSGGIWMLSVGN